MTQPKLYTNHYNVNGLNVYRSKLTIIAFIMLIQYLLFIMVFRITPLFLAHDHWYVSSEIISIDLEQTLNLTSTSTPDETNKPFLDNFWLKYI